MKIGGDDQKSQYKYVGLINLGSSSSLLVSTSGSPVLKQAMENGSTGPIYLGWALPGTDQDTTGWVICKYTYSGSFVVKVEFAGGTANFDNVWDDRATYTYSS